MAGHAMLITNSTSQKASLMNKNIRFYWILYLFTYTVVIINMSYAVSRYDRL